MAGSIAEVLDNGDGSTVTLTTRKCVVCNKPSVFIVAKSEYEAWQGGTLIQSVWPQMPANIREQFISGTHPECFDKLFGEDGE